MTDPRWPWLVRCSGGREGERLDAWAEVVAHGWEGYVGKDNESRYRDGRSSAWL